MIKTKVAFLEARLFSSPSELFENFLNCSDWLDKSRPSKKARLENSLDRKPAPIEVIM